MEATEAEEEEESTRACWGGCQQRACGRAMSVGGAFVGDDLKVVGSTGVEEDRWEA